MNEASHDRSGISQERILSARGRYVRRNGERDPGAVVAMTSSHSDYAR